MARREWLETLLSDARYGSRLMLRQPAFTALAVIALSLGIGVNAAIFSIANAVILRPLPYPDADRLVLVWERFLQQGLDRIPVSASEFTDYESQAQSFEHIAAFRMKDFNFTWDGTPERVPVALVSASLFPMLGVKPTAGRFFLPEENQFGKDQVVIVSYGFWQNMLGGETNIVGRSIRLDGQQCEVVGIAPVGFNFPMSFFDIKGVTHTQPPEVWRPITLTESQLKQRGGRGLGVIAMLKRDVTRAQANAEVQSIAEGMLARFPSSYPSEGWGAGVFSLRDQLVSGVQAPLLVLLGAAAFVLLIACANIGNLLLSRAAAREKEVAVRAALGASRARIVRQLLTESLLLALAGGAAGLVLANWATNLLVSYGAHRLPRIRQIGFDWVVLAFAAGLSLLTVVVFGLVPAIHAARGDLAGSLKSTDRFSPSSVVNRRLRYLAIVGQVALTFLLLSGATVMAKSLWRLLAVDPGLKADNVLTLQITLPASSYPDAQSLTRFYEQLLARISGLPMIDSAGAASILPLSGSNNDTSFIIEGNIPTDVSLVPDEEVRVVTPGYFEAMGIPVESGRLFTEADRPSNLPVVIINRAFATRYFDDEGPLGKRITLDDPRRPTAKWLTIVGVVGDIRHRGLNEPARPEFYLPHLQYPEPSMYVVMSTTTAQDPAALTSAAGLAIAGMDRNLPTYNVRKMEEIVVQSLAQQRLMAVVLGVFGALALVLATFGIYGVVSYSVAQRTREIGIRMALGARGSDISRAFVKQGLKLTLLGIALGAIAAIPLNRLIQNLLYEVSAIDPVVLALIGLSLAAVAALACYIPARRATHVDSMVALRYE